MKYAHKRLIKYLSIMLSIGLIAAAVFFMISRVVRLGDGINAKTDKKYEPTEGTDKTAAHLGAGQMTRESALPTNEMLTDPEAHLVVRCAWCDRYYHTITGAYVEKPAKDCGDGICAKCKADMLA